MITKTTPKGWMLTLLSALFLLSGLTACSSTEDSAEDSAKPKPEVPINDDDWQTVPATGGTITKDSLSIIFPKGSFPEDTKVAITEVQKGKTGGKYEASKFYQITLPTSLSQLVTFKVKSSEKSDDISFVAHSPGFCTSTLSEVTIETQFKTDYVNGEYSSTIALVDEVEDNENVSLTIGLAHIPSISSSTTRQTRGIKEDIKDIAKNIASNINTETLAKGKVKNVNYKIVIPLDTWSMYSNSDIVKLEMMSKKVSEYIEQAFKKIFDLGFKVPGEERVITVSYREGKNWGGFGHSMWNKDWSTMTMGIEKLFDPKTTDEDIKCTVIHELFHFVQAGYDPRWSYKKGTPIDKNTPIIGGLIGVDRREELNFCEMGAVWIEHLMNNGQLNAQIINEVVSSPIKYDKMGLTDVNDLWSYGPVSERYQNQGYSTAPLLYYLCSMNKFKDFDLDNKAVVELHELWRDNFGKLTTMQCLENWVFSTHNCGFFMGTDIDDYYIKLLDGTLINGVDVLSLYANDSTYTEGRKADLIVNANLDKFPRTFENVIFPFGCTVRTIRFQGLKDVSLKNKKLVIKQESEGVQTYLMTTGKSSEYKSYRRTSQIAKGNDSIVISGNTLEGLRLSDGSFDQYFVIVTTRTSNSTSDKGGKPWKVTAELQDEKKEEQPVTKGMISKMYMLATMAGKTDGGSSTYFGFGFSTESELHAPPAITTKKDGSTLHVESSQEYTHAIQWGHQTEKQSVSFDILNFTGDLKNVTITNFKIYSKTVASVSPPPDEWIIMGDDEEGEIVLNNIVNPSVKEMDDGTIRLYFKNGTWEVTAEYGLLEVISGYCIKSGSSSSRTYSYDDSQVAEIEMELYFNK